MNKFKVNDLVKVYGSSQIREECHNGVKGLVIGLVKGGDWVNVYIENFGTCTFHSKQLRRLKTKANPEPRKVARRWFVELEHNGDVRWGRDHAFVCKAGGEIVQVNEILPGQVLVSREELEKIIRRAVERGSNTNSFTTFREITEEALNQIGLSEKGGDE